MRRLGYLFLLIIFGVWVIPLGAFYSTEQASRACGGHRAICLCLQESKDKNSDQTKTSNLSPRAVNLNGHENGGNANEHMLLLDLLVLIPNSATAFENPEFLIPNQIVLKLPDPIPKS